MRYLRAYPLEYRLLESQVLAALANNLMSYAPRGWRAAKITDRHFIYERPLRVASGAAGALNKHFVRATVHKYTYVRKVYHIYSTYMYEYLQVMGTRIWLCVDRTHMR